MHFAVTGGAGFIGGHLVRLLADKGHRVTVIDNKPCKVVHGNINIKTLDILDYDKLENVLSTVDKIFHQAALTSVSESYIREDQYKLVNVTGTENIFKIAQQYGQKVVYASSSSVYGNTDALPIREDSELKPVNPYGMTKLEDEILAVKYTADGAKIIGLRYFNVFGKGQTLDYAGVITKFLDRIHCNQPLIIFGDGSHSRDFVYVEDVAKANLAAMTSTTNSGFFNVGTGNATTVKELAEKMISLSGKNLGLSFEKLPDGDVKSSQADVALATHLISWRAETTLDEGLSTFF